MKLLCLYLGLLNLIKANPVSKALKTRNYGTMTEKAFWGGLKSLLRNYSMKNWKPGEAYLKTVRRTVKEIDLNHMSLALFKGKHQYGYPCADCKAWFTREEVVKDHYIPCGGFYSFKEMGEVAERMFIEIDDGWQCMCKPCHDLKTNEEKRRVK